MVMTDFSLPGYRALLESLLERGYGVRSYAEADRASRHLVLRHDIDMSLQAAEPIAAIESELGVTACYFVLLRSEMYNPFSPASRSSIDKIRGLGHTIGLHLDASVYPDNAAALDAAASEECAMLEAVTGSAVDVISFHRPAPALIGYNKPLAGRRHAYEPCFVEDMGYVSDSRGGWHHGHPIENPAVAAGRALQLLTHPIWWSGSQPGPLETLESFHRDRCDLLDRELARNCSIYQPPEKNRTRT
jgi:hypothetical protein